MISPFKYGGVVGRESFCNREHELRELGRSVENSGKLFIHGERRIGKSSLLKHFIDSLSDDRYIVAFVDVWRCVDTSDFVRECAAVFGSTGSQSPKKLLQRAASLFSGLRPALTVDDNGRPQLTFSNIYRKTDTSLLSEVLNAPMRIAESSPDHRVLVVFDEFQEIRNFNDERIERILRSEVQKQQNIAYVFCGSRKHLLREMFLKGGSPLYRSAAHFPIGCIRTEHWIPFIKERFLIKGISLENIIIEDICSLTEGHPFYTQMICDILWDSCEPGQEPDKEMLNEVLRIVLDREAEGYQAVWESLPSNPRKMLLAAAFENPLIKPFSGHIVYKYNLANPSSARSGLEYLVSRDLVEPLEGKYSITDRFMTLWLKRRFNGSF